MKLAALCVLLAGVLPVLCHAAAPQRCRAVVDKPYELRNKFSDINVCEPVSPLVLFSHLWAPVKVKVTCGSSKVGLFTPETSSRVWQTPVQQAWGGPWGPRSPDL